MADEINNRPTTEIVIGVWGAIKGQVAVGARFEPEEMIVLK